MNRSSIVGVLSCLTLAAPALAQDPGAPAPAPAPDAAPAPAPDTNTVPAYDVLYLADKPDTAGPDAVVRTGARTEEEWTAIGRDLRAKRPNQPVMVVIFISEHAIPVPEGYPDCEPDKRQAFERWTLGTYVYQARSSQYNTTGEVIENVKQNVASARKRTMNGVDIIELHEPDPTDIRNAPAVQRIVGVSVVVPGLKDEDLQDVALAYENEFGTPRLLQIVFFDAEPDWPDKPFMTTPFFEQASRAYLRSSRAKDEAQTQIVPLAPRWVTLKDGEVTEK